jgi:magnesium chelatase subunit I
MLKILYRKVTIQQDFQLKISQICSELKIEGLRGDIVSTRAAKALAAFEIKIRSNFR